MLRRLSDFNKVTRNETVISLHEENNQHFHHICTMSARNSKRLRGSRLKQVEKLKIPMDDKKKREEEVNSLYFSTRKKNETTISMLCIHL